MNCFYDRFMLHFLVYFMVTETVTKMLFIEQQFCLTLYNPLKRVSTRSHTEQNEMISFQIK